MHFDTDIHAANSQVYSIFHASSNLVLRSYATDLEEAYIMYIHAIYGHYREYYLGLGHDWGLFTHVTYLLLHSSFIG